MNWNIPLDDERTLSVRQFCEIEGLSIEAFSHLEVSGAAPTKLCIKCKDGVEVDRITPEARREWHNYLRGKAEELRVSDENTKDWELSGD